MNPILNPTVPLNVPIPGGVQPGKLIKIQGFTPYVSNRFAVNLICSPTGDVALHVSPKFDQKCVVRNTIQNMQMGYEERSGIMPIQPGQNFELLILCDHQDFKIAFNGQHFAEFNHKLSYSAITNLGIDGQVNIYSINFDVNNNTSRNIGLVIPPNTNYAPPPDHAVPPYSSRGPTGGMPYPANPPNYAAYPPQTGYGNPAAPYSQPSPMGQSGGYPNSQPPHGLYPQQPPSGHPGGYPSSQPAHGLYPQQPSSGHPGGYPHSQPMHGGYPHSPKSSKSSGFLDKAGMAVAGALGTSALLGGHKNKLGVLGEKLGAAVATATALTDRLNPKKAMKKQMKAQKKALKYGLPLAGAGIGAYALSKGIRGFRRSSSSSSSSSD